MSEPSTPSTRAEPRKRSLFTLLEDLPGLLAELVRGEIEQLKKEITDKLKAAGIGIGLIAGAAAFLFFTGTMLVVAGVLALALVVPAWAAALIVGGASLLGAVILGLSGVLSLRKGVPPAPTETMNSVKQDINTIKGIGKRART